MRKLYCISGLGSDEKAFARIRVPGYKLVHLKWLIPLKNESIQEYAKRMSAAVEEENPVLMGLSFGGIMCTEIARHIKVDKIILLSSVRSAKEMPRWMRIVGMLRLNRVVPLKPSSSLTRPIQDYHIGAVTKEEKEMVRQYRENVNQDYLEWAINAILNWKSESTPAAIVQIHGDADRIFPVNKVHPDFVVKGGTHFMVFSKAKEISQFLASVLTNEEDTIPSR